MSLILDALRKSEHERQRQAGPALAVAPEGLPRGRPAGWMLVLGGLLALNMVVLAALLLTERRSEPAAEVPSPAAAVAAVATPSPATATERLRATPLTLPAQPPRHEVRPLNTEVTAAPAPATRRSTPSAGDTVRAGSVPEVEQAVEDVRLPRFTDLVVRGELNVPHMHLDIHVFSADPDERFVFINMRRYNEGDATQEGPRVVRVARDGVVMDHRGQRFFLSRD